MPNPEIFSSNGAFAFAAEHNVPVADDLNRNFDWFPRLTVANQPIVRPGVEYAFSQIDYIIGETNVQANRIITKIPPGNRTELAYWTAAAPEQQLTVHRGIGELLLARIYEDGTHVLWPLVLEPGAVAEQRTLSPRSFYCLHALPDSPEPLVVSSFYQPPVTSWEALEIEVEPGQQHISAPESEIAVPRRLVERLSQL